MIRTPIYDFFQQGPCNIGLPFADSQLRQIEPSVDGVFAALPGQVDVIDAVFARLLFWTDPLPLPAVGDVEGAWQCYLRTWNPGAYSRGTPPERWTIGAPAA